jgi:hypothetical protein
MIANNWIILYNFDRLICVCVRKSGFKVMSNVYLKSLSGFVVLFISLITFSPIAWAIPVATVGSTDFLQA